MGFETMPQIEDLEIAATWDEIELEAALRLSAEPQAASGADTQSSLMEALHAIEALQKLPKAERKQRAEELLRSLTSAPARELAEPYSAPDAAAALPAEEPPSVELLAASPDNSTSPADELPSIEPVVTLLENVTPPPDEPPSVELVATGSENSTPPPDEPSSAEPIAPEPVPEISALTKADPVPEAVAEASIGVLLAAEAASALPAPEFMPESAPPVPEIAAGRDAIPKFLATECASFEADHPDSLIPFHTAAGGNAKAQIGVGKTYDPLVLAKLRTRGVRGDPVQAASWYARAGESGDAEGQQRLHALISGLSDCMLSQATCAARKP